MRILYIMSCTLLSFSILALENTVQKNSAALANDDKDNASIIKEQYVDLVLKQQTNEEQWEYFFSNQKRRWKEDGLELSSDPEIIKKHKQRFSSEKQQYYDIYAKTLLHAPPVFPQEFGNLDMSKMKQLQWVVETNKNSYLLQEPIGFRLSLKNISENDIRVCQSTCDYSSFVLNSIQLTRLASGVQEKKQKRINLTENGYNEYSYLHYIGQSRILRSTVLKTGENVSIQIQQRSVKTLNQYYDLSIPGEYELTFYTRNFLGGDENQIGEWPKPCTIRFTIEDKMYEPEIKWDDLNPQEDSEEE